MGRNITMSRRHFLELCGVAGSALGAVSLAACGGTSSDGGDAAATTDGADITLTIGLEDEPESMDIQQVGYDDMVHQLLYEPLICYSADMSEVQPAFATKFETSEDGLTFTFTLPEDATFSNGDAIDANAVDASVKRYLATSQYASDYDSVDSFEVVDDHTYAMHLKTPAPFMMASLCSPYSGVVEASQAESMGNDAFGRAPIANGPYVVDNWEQGNQVTLKRNENYKTNNPNLSNQGVPNVGTVVFRFIPDEFTRVSEVESGDVDVILTVPTASVEEVKGNADLTAYDYMLPGVDVVYFNTDVIPDAVREAMTYAVNRDELVAALDGNVTPTFGYIASSQSCYDADEEDKLKGELAFDLDKAKQVLADAGYTDSDGDGFVEVDGTKASYEMLVPSDRTALTNAAPVLQQQFAAAGIDVQIRAFENAYIKTQTSAGDYQITLRAYKWADPDILYSFFTPASGYPWEDATVTETLTNAREESDTDKRVEDYVEFQEAMKGTHKAISLFAENLVAASKAAVQNLHITADGRLWVNDVTE